jgi:hypothetical protein
MASIKNLKKDINYVLGDVIEYALDVSILKNAPEKGEVIIDEAIEIFDNLVSKINESKVENKKTHFKAIHQELETKAKSLVEKINSL